MTAPPCLHTLNRHIHTQSPPWGYRFSLTNLHTHSHTNTQTWNQPVYEQQPDTESILTQNLMLIIYMHVDTKCAHLWEHINTNTHTHTQAHWAKQILPYPTFAHYNSPPHTHSFTDTERERESLTCIHTHTLRTAVRHSPPHTVQLALASHCNPQRSSSADGSAAYFPPSALHHCLVL